MAITRINEFICQKEDMALILKNYDCQLECMIRMLHSVTAVDDVIKTGLRQIYRDKVNIYRYNYNKFTAIFVRINKHIYLNNVL